MIKHSQLISLILFFETHKFKNPQISDFSGNQENQHPWN